jgi:hypothetical protein
MISFDLDGVLRNFTRGFTQIAHDLFGTPVGGETSQTSWSFEGMTELGLTIEQCAFDGPVWSVIRNSPIFWQQLDPLNTSVMRRIDAIVNKVFITNTIGVNALEQSVDFLERWGIYNPRVVLSADKGTAMRAEHVVAHIDDYIKNCTEMKDADPNVYIALFDVPYSHAWIPAWRDRGGDVVLSVEHFIDECEKRGLVKYGHATVRLGARW